MYVDDSAIAHALEWVRRRVVSWSAGFAAALRMASGMQIPGLEKFHEAGQDVFKQFFSQVANSVLRDARVVVRPTRQTVRGVRGQNEARKCRQIVPQPASVVLQWANMHLDGLSMHLKQTQCGDIHSQQTGRSRLHSQQINRARHAGHAPSSCLSRVSLACAALPPLYLVLVFLVEVAPAGGCCRTVSVSA
ncbi:hypothetical protein BU16DRAFT_588685 [Lophium mytilinum]|uniref:Uncharacterized protein n=1 Tax=Lophium mytilinum TaxID=390894 RepID=A0A6A6REM1_9PEZI|nr:hypothetical protein BU16DRAFT_588685 [Lophium mytilinum]